MSGLEGRRSCRASSFRHFYRWSAQRESHVPDLEPPAPSSKPDILFTISHPAVSARQLAIQPFIKLSPVVPARLHCPQGKATQATCTLLCYFPDLHEWVFRPGMHRKEAANKKMSDHREADSRYPALWSNRGMAGYAEGISRLPSCVKLETWRPCLFFSQEGDASFIASQTSNAILEVASG